MEEKTMTKNNSDHLSGSAKTCDSGRFGLIQLWLHIHQSIGYYIKNCVASGEYADDQAVADALQDQLDILYSGLWFRASELLEVWRYECAHKGSYYTCEDYMLRQEINRTFP